MTNWQHNLAVNKDIFEDQSFLYHKHNKPWGEDELPASNIMLRNAKSFVAFCGP